MPTRLILQFLCQIIAIGLAVFPMLTFGVETSLEQQQLYDRILESIRRLEQQRQEEVILPGEDQQQEQQSKQQEESAEAQQSEAESLPGSKSKCFPIQRIKVSAAGEAVPHLQRWVTRQVQSWQGLCLSLVDLKTLQKELNNGLIARGYITSRVLLPEQQIADGELTLQLVAGRVEAVESQSFASKLIEAALPSRRQQLLNLRDLEQTVENLNRLPGMDFSFDLKPGTAYGTSRLQAQGQWSRRYRLSWLANESYYGSTAHGNSQLSMEWGSLFGQPDRLILGLNSDLDREISDQAQGGFLNYDLSLGYWLLSASANRQVYENRLPSIQKIDASGSTDLSQLELMRILYRSSKARLGLAVQAGYADVRNLLNETTIGVSSYRLTSTALRMDFSQVLGKNQLAAALSYEQARADGPATDLPGSFSVADVEHQRWHLSSSLQRRFAPFRSELRLKLNAQYTEDQLFPSERFSLASSSVVRAYDGIAISGNSGAAATLEANMLPGFGNTSPGKLTLQPFLAYDTGVIPFNSNEDLFVRLSSITLGSRIGYGLGQMFTQVSWPLEQFSTQAPEQEYTVNLVLAITY